MKVAFLVHHFSVRGSEIATFDYAYWNEILLRNQSIIVIPRDYQQHKHYTGEQVNNLDVEKKFRTSFPVLCFDSYEHLDEILREEGCDVLYHLKSGEKDVDYKFSVPYAVHCIFTCTESHRHGDVYAAVSQDVNKAGAPVVPHICTPLPDSKTTLYRELNIPGDALVYGYYGGSETFNIPFVQDTIKWIVENHRHIHFIFMNITPFHHHPQIHYIPASVNSLRKSAFVNTCTAMLYARAQGESFGLAIAEFTSKGKPIIVYKHPIENRNHLDVLGDTAIYYEDEKDLYQILTEFDPSTAPVPIDYAHIFNPRDVMKRFGEVFLEGVIEEKESSCVRIQLLCNWTTTTEVHYKWQKLIGDYPVRFVENNPDYWVILNKPPEGAEYDPQRTIVFGMEPDTFTNPRWQWYTNKEDFFYFMDENYMNAWEWWLTPSQSTLAIHVPSKVHDYDKIVSTVVSSQYTYPGHKLRIDFLREAEKELPFHIYGYDNQFGFESYRKALPIGKDEGLFPYKYTFAAENTQRPNYCTEKLIDGILAECLVFYWGCPNLGEFLDPQCFLPLDLTNVKESIRTIREAIEGNEWEKRIDVIRKMKKRILCYYSFVPRLLGLIRVLNLDKRTVNLDSRPDKWERHITECRKAQLHGVKRFSAICGSDYDLGGEYIQSLFLLTQNFVGNNKNSGAIVGCALSHYTLWREVIANNRVMLVMEDDVTFQPRFVDRLAYYLQHLDTVSDWDVVFIGFHGHEDNCDAHGLPHTFLEDNFHHCDLVSYQYMTRYGTRSDASGLHGGGTFGYLISPQGARRLVDVIKKCRIYFPIDYMMLECGLHYGLKIYVTPHQLVKSPKYGFDTKIV